MIGYVYAIECEGMVKIGFSVCPYHRFTTIQTFSPFECRLVGVMAGDFRQEAALHRRFASQRVRGEWFTHDGDVAEFVAAMEKPDPFQLEAELTETQKVVTRISPNDAAIIDLWPSAEHFAQDIGLRFPSHARVMKLRGRIPKKYLSLVEQAAKRRGIDLPEVEAA